MDKLNLSEISLFISEEVYLVKNEPLPPIAEHAPEEPEEELIEEIKEPVLPKADRPSYKSILFLTEEPLRGLASETFTNITNKALGLTERDYTLLTQDQISFDKVDEPNSQKIVSFGIPFSGYSTKYKINSLENKLYLYADPLDKIAQEVDLKRQLWTQLQLMFPKK